MKRRKARTQAFVRYWLPPITWAVVIFVQSSFRVPTPAPAGFRISDKTLHMGVYAALAWLVFRALRRGSGMGAMRAATWAFVATALYGATDELHQGLVPSRTMEWGDWFADLAGAATVLLAAPAMRLIQRFGGTSRGVSD